jgi:ankyrin repeat protein
LKHDKVDVNLEDDDGDTGFLLASRNGHIDTVVGFSKHKKVIVNYQSKYGHTALSLASINGHSDIVWELLKHNLCEALACTTAKGDDTKLASPWRIMAQMKNVARMKGSYK